MNSIGGYFGLELKVGQQAYHETPYTFKSGRSSLHYILKFLKPSLVYIPFYTCNAMMESFEAAGVAYKYYEIDKDLNPVALPVLKEGEYFLYINYFDIKRNTVAILSDKFRDRLIVDCSQAFFMQGNGNSWFFNSCRKFFGVPDGSYLYAPADIKLSISSKKNESYFFAHLLDRFNGHPAKGYHSFIKNEIACDSEIASMSKLTEVLLSNVHYEPAADRRRSNFNYLHHLLSELNLLNFKMDAQNVPMCYPLLLSFSIKKELLFQKNIFIPMFWNDVLKRNNNGFQLEKTLTKNLLPIPIDHRYSVNDMDRLLNTIKCLYEEFSLSKAS